MTSFTESVVEEAALAWFEKLSWRIAHVQDNAPDVPGAERSTIWKRTAERWLKGEW